MLADLETVSKRVDKLEREAKKQDKESIAKLATVKKIKETLERGELANKTELDKSDENVSMAIKELSLLTMKPFLYVYNVSDIDRELDSELESRPHVKLDIKIEEEIDEMSKEDREEMGIESGLDKLIVESYNVLNLITFLTTGEDESRAWTIRKDSTAPQAGAAIHNDFKDTFVCAEVIRWDDLLEYGSMSKAKEVGKVKTVGKEYIVEDGDVMEFKAGK
jgi:ribosome-binding ATPase YchF (GTP1/OBG family)